MDMMKGKIQEKIVKLRDLSDYTAKVVEDAEAELLQVFNEKTHDMTRFDTLLYHLCTIVIVAFLSTRRVI